MAESLLTRVLLNEVHLEHLLKWLRRKNSDTDEFTSSISSFRCSQSDFLSYFLNYIHDEAPCSSATVDNAAFALKPVKKQDSEERAPKKLLTVLAADARANEFDLKQINGFSTPKLIRNALNESNSSYTSPVSPLYLNSNSKFITPKYKRPPNSAQKSNERTLCLGDFIVHKTSSGKKKAQKNLGDFIENECDGKSKKSRRINPTKLKHSDNFQTLNNGFNFQNEFIELCVDNTNEQRSLLAQECVKIASEVKFDDTTKLVGNYNLQDTSKPEVKADYKLVTHRRELDVLTEIYSFVLKNNLVLNFTSELYFLISLLTTKCYADESDVEINSAAVINTRELSSDEIDFLVTNALFLKTLLNMIHNSVYFAVGTLSLLADAVHFLDRSTIKLLMENENVRGYSDGLSLFQSLSAIYEGKTEQPAGFIEDIQRNNVCFISDTDNRENFPSDASFHAFRKQRDLFYDILRIWEQNHCVSEWSFSIALGGKIKSLLNLYNDPVNFRHFARLFKAQLLTTCGNCNSEEGITETEMSFLSAIANVNVDKLCRLKSRLVTKQVTEGINSVPQFPGHQEFYKEFIVSSSLHMFHVHLRDSLILEISQLNDTKFCDGELNETGEPKMLLNISETNVDPTTKISYLACVKSLRILAKFLGFLESLSYKIDCKLLTEKILASEIKTRQRIQPAFDLKRMLTIAVRRRALILTIPWLVKYLSMLDYVTLRLPYYEDVFKILFHVHLNYVASSNDLLLRLSLGWLFELPHFPGNSYFRWYLEESASDLMLDGDCDGCQERNVQKSLDELEIVDTNILYTCCPYLEEIKKLLICNSGSKNAVIKHITPLSAIDSSADISEKKLKLQLEEVFFNSQPISVRKMVEFVSERVASACVKFICNKTVPVCKKSFSVEFRKEMIELNESPVSLKARADFLAQDCLKKLHIACLEEADEMARERFPVSIEMMMSSDELVQVKETCAIIAKRMCLSRVQQWMNSHVNLGIFNSEIQKLATEKIKDKPAFLLPPGGREVPHNPDTPSAVKLMENIRQLSINVLEKNLSLAVADVDATLDAVKKSIQERCDMNDSVSFVINKMLLDLYLLLLVHRGEVSADGVLMAKFADHWNVFSKPNEDLFKTVVSPRNIMLLAQSSDIKISWEGFTQFIILLLKRGLLTSEALESQCVMMYQNEWDKATLKHLSGCFRAIVDEFAQDGGNQNFTCLLSFISGFCSDMDIL